MRAAWVLMMSRSDLCRLIILCRALQGFDETDDGGEWGFQLMTGIGDEILPHFLHLPHPRLILDHHEGGGITRAGRGEGMDMRLQFQLAPRPHQREGDGAGDTIFKRILHRLDQSRRANNGDQSAAERARRFCANEVKRRAIDPPHALIPVNQNHRCR